MHHTDRHHQTQNTLTHKRNGMRDAQRMRRRHHHSPLVLLIAEKPTAAQTTDPRGSRTSARRTPPLARPRPQTRQKEDCVCFVRRNQAHRTSSSRSCGLPPAPRARTLEPPLGATPYSVLRGLLPVGFASSKSMSTTSRKAVPFQFLLMRMSAATAATIRLGAHQRARGCGGFSKPVDRAVHRILTHTSIPRCILQ